MSDENTFKNYQKCKLSGLNFIGTKDIIKWMENYYPDYRLYHTHIRSKTDTDLRYCNRDF